MDGGKDVGVEFVEEGVMVRSEGRDVEEFVDSVRKGEDNGGDVGRLMKGEVVVGFEMGGEDSFEGVEGVNGIGGMGVEVGRLGWGRLGRG